MTPGDAAGAYVRLIVLYRECHYKAGPMKKTAALKTEQPTSKRTR
jgi:hypothetical protein